MDNKHLVNIAINHINEDNAHNIDGITKDIIERIDDEGKRLSTSIERSAEEIKLQASKINDITSNISDLSITSEEIIANVSSIKKTTAGLLDEQAQMSMKSDEISASVSRSNMDIDELSGRIQSAEFKITPEAIISTVTDSTTYTDDISGITTRLNEAEQKITPESIVSTVRDSVEYQGDFNSINEDVIALNDSLVDLEGFVVTAEGKIVDLETLVEDIDGNLVDLEGNIVDLEDGYENLQGRIVSAESSITQNATNISSKVSITDYDGNTIASKINQSATTISIDASRINLNGAVTFNSFNPTLQSSINNKADSSDLGGLAYRDTVAKSNLVPSLQTEINAKVNETTIIQGGYIKTSLIKADELYVGGLTSTGTINVTTDATIGNNLLLGSQYGSDSKEISFNSGARIYNGSGAGQYFLTLEGMSIALEGAAVFLGTAASSYTYINGTLDLDRTTVTGLTMSDLPAGSSSTISVTRNRLRVADNSYRAYVFGKTVYIYFQYNPSLNSYEFKQYDSAVLSIGSAYAPPGSTAGSAYPASSNNVGTPVYPYITTGGAIGVVNSINNSEGIGAWNCSITYVMS